MLNNLNTILYSNLYLNGSPKFDISLSSNYIQLLNINNVIDKEKKNVIVFDMIWCFGGTYTYLQSLINLYSTIYNFIIIRETSDLNIYISINDQYLYSNENHIHFNLNEIKNFLDDIQYDFIFINKIGRAHV